MRSARDAVGIILVAAAATFAADPPKGKLKQGDGQPTAQESLQRIAQAAPTIRAALVRDAQLRRELGKAACADTLEQVAALCASSDQECQEALRIIGDAVPRVRSDVGPIRLDGKAEEWQGVLPASEGGTAVDVDAVLVRLRGARNSPCFASARK